MWKEVKCKLAIMAISILISGYTCPAFVEAATSTAHVTIKVIIEPSSRLTLNDSSNDPNMKSGATASVRTTERRRRYSRLRQATIP